MTEINADGSRTVIPNSKKIDIEFGLSEPNKIKFTNHDGKILAEIPVDDLISKEHNDSLDALSYAIREQAKISDTSLKECEKRYLENDIEATKELFTVPDMVNHPAHYNVNGFEVIDIIKAFTEGLEGIQAVDTANAIKYILRWHHKNGVEDLKKARWYINHLIEEIENKIYKEGK